MNAIYLCKGWNAVAVTSQAAANRLKADGYIEITREDYDAIRGIDAITDEREQKLQHRKTNA